MNKVLRDAYFHICNGGCNIRVEVDEKTKFPVFVVDSHSYGNLNMSFEMLTRKEYIHALGVMLIEAAGMCEEPKWSGQTLAKMYWVNDENGKEIREYRRVFGFTND